MELSGGAQPQRSYLCAAPLITLKTRAWVDSPDHAWMATTAIPSCTGTRSPSCARTSYGSSRRRRSQPGRIPSADAYAALTDEGGIRRGHRSVPLSGGIPRRLSDTPGLLAHPRFSPDGKWIAFTVQHQGSCEEVRVGARRDPCVGSDAPATHA